MDFVENIWVSKERTEAGFGAKHDRSSPVLNTWVVSRIRILEDTPTQSDELTMTGFLFMKHIIQTINVIPRLLRSPALHQTQCGASVARNDGGYLTSAINTSNAPMCNCFGSSCTFDLVALENNKRKVFLLICLALEKSTSSCFSE